MATLLQQHRAAFFELQDDLSKQRNVHLAGWLIGPYTHGFDEHALQVS